MFVPRRIMRQYPHLARFVRDELWTIPYLPEKAAVWEAFVECSRLPKSEAEAVLSASGTPILEVAVPVGPVANGVFSPVMPDRIFIAKAICDRFEHDHVRPEAKLLVESALLHELVLWGVWNEEPFGRTWVAEQSAKFDQMAYGGHIPRYWQDHSLSA